MKRVCSIFSQILQLIPRDRFEEAVIVHKTERHARGFSRFAPELIYEDVEPERLSDPAMEG